MDVNVDFMVHFRSNSCMHIQTICMVLIPWTQMYKQTYFFFRAWSSIFWGSHLLWPCICIQMPYYWDECERALYLWWRFLSIILSLWCIVCHTTYHAQTYFYTSSKLHLLNTYDGSLCDKDSLQLIGLYSWISVVTLRGQARLARVHAVLEPIFTDDLFMPSSNSFCLLSCYYEHSLAISLMNVSA